MAVYELISDAEIAQELATAASKPRDVNDDALPFSHLGGARFEVLSYLLRRAETAATGTAVTLVKLSGDKGRDLLVHDAGQLREIVQCKNLAVAITKPAVVREVLKLALHSRLDPTVLPGNVDQPVGLSLWCTGGFSGPAADFIDTWPNGWNQATIRPGFDEVVEEYKSLSNLTWATEEGFLLEKLPNLVKLLKRGPLDLSQSVREHVGIYERFFQGMVVASMADVEATIDKRLAQLLLQNNLRNVSDDDVRRILDRVASFAAEDRFYYGFGYIFGVPLQLMADMPPQSRNTLFQSMAGPALTAKLFTEMIPRKANAMAEAAKPHMPHDHRVFPMIVNQTLTMRALAQVGRISMPVFLSEKRPPELRKAELWDLIDGLCTRAWDDFTAILSPDFKHPTTDASLEQLRKNIAAHALRGFQSKSEFVDLLRNDCRANLPRIRELVAEIEAYFPKDLLFIVDSKSMFDVPEMMMTFRDTMSKLDLLMAEPERPS